MKFMLMMNCPRDGYDKFGEMPQKDIQAHIGYMIALNRKLSAAGELVAAEGLATPMAALRVRAGNDGKPVTDGVFPESKEFLAGYWIVDVDSAARANEIAAEASMAPVAGGVPMRMWIEVREVMSGPPTD